MKSHRSVSLTFLLLALLPIAKSQNITGQICGLVTDPAGAVVADAKSPANECALQASARDRDQGQWDIRVHRPCSGHVRCPHTGQALEASDDGHAFHVVAAIPDGASAERTIAFPAATAKFFRVTFRKMAPAEGRSAIPGFSAPAGARGTAPAIPAGT